MKKEFLDKFEKNVIPLSKEANLAYFEATISGRPEDYKKTAELETNLEKIFSDRSDFETIKKIRAAEKLDATERRVFEKLYLSYLSSQLDFELLEKIIHLQNQVEEKFNTFRVSIGEKTLTDNEIETILINSTNSGEAESAWLASKKIGDIVEKDTLALIKLRNQAATKLGFDNFHQMQLELHEQSEEGIEKIFDEAGALTKTAFWEIKNKEIDPFLSKRFGIGLEDLMPWHYQNRYFQEAPQVYSFDLDKVYGSQDLVAITQNYYSKIDLPIESILKKSDLFEKPGKYQHAYCIGIDRTGDVRVVCNVKPNRKWMDTLLHEFGHGVYDSNIDRKLPWALRIHGHIFLTEAVAIFFGRLASNPDWIGSNLNIRVNPEESGCVRKQLALEKLIFSRWSQVMYRFEKGMYENPDQNLNDLWWGLVEKYQNLKRPKNWDDRAYWASKIHIVSSPAYYHNYLLGDFFASMLTDYLKDKKIPMDSKELGQFFKKEIFGSGALLRWDQLIKRAVGRELSPDSFVKEFVGK